MSLLRFDWVKMRASQLYDELVKKNTELKGVVMGNKPKTWAFAVFFSGTDFGLSISCGNMVADTSEEVFETALVRGSKDDNKLFYDNDAGYDDVLVFGSVDDLVAEIQRVQKLAAEGKIGKEPEKKAEA
jgi:hypothetical protein